MKTSLLSLVFIALAALSFHALADMPTNTPAATGPLRPSGSVSASGASTLDDLQAQLAEKAHQQGALAWRINAAGGGNKLMGSAILYK